MHMYLFFREGMFYPISCKSDEDARVQAEMNPGTLKVEAVERDGKTRVVWRRQ